MPIFPWRRKIYRLKGRNANNEWEVVGEYDRFVRASEISDEIRDLVEQGYTYFYLEECDKKGEKCRKRWAYKPKNPEDIAVGSTLEKVKKYKELVESVKEALGIKDISLDDVVASFVYHRTLAEQLLKAMGLSEDKINQILSPSTKQQGGKGEFEEFIEFIKSMSQLRGALPMQIPIPQAPAPQAPAPAPTPVPPPQVKEEVRRKAEEIVAKAQEKAEEAVMPPCMKGKYKEGEEE